MKKYILCYGDSNTHGYNPVNRLRYEKNIRWTGRMAAILGENYQVIEEGLNSRTTNLEPEGEPWRSVLYYLEPCLRNHMPLNLVILMMSLVECGQWNCRESLHRSTKKLQQKKNVIL